MLPCRWTAQFPVFAPHVYTFATGSYFQSTALRAVVRALFWRLTMLPCPYSHVRVLLSVPPCPCSLDRAHNSACFSTLCHSPMCYSPLCYSSIRATAAQSCHRAIVYDGSFLFFAGIWEPRRSITTRVCMPSIAGTSAKVAVTRTIR